MSYATEVSQGSEDSNLPDIIRELRIQNTDTSHKLANQLEQQLSAANMNTPAI
jgi:hypothetical protein